MPHLHKSSTAPSESAVSVSCLLSCSSDGVRSVYAQFSKLPRLTRECAPALHSYLEEGEQQPAAAQVRLQLCCNLFAVA